MIRQLAITAMAAIVATGLLAAAPASTTPAKPKASAPAAQAKAPVRHVKNSAKKPATAKSFKTAPVKKTSGRLPARTRKSMAPRSSRPVNHRGAARKGTTAAPTSSTPPTTRTR